MSQSRVGEVRLHLRVPGALEAEVPRLRAAIERKLVVDVLEAFERAIHAALGPDAIVHVRHLALRWQLDEPELRDASTAPRLADELARDVLTELAAQAPAERLRPHAPGLVAFLDAHHADAARLADLADQRGDLWFHAGRPPAPAIWDATAAAGPAAIAALVAWLERMMRLDAALAFASEPVLAAVAAAVPARAAAVALVRARRAPVASAAPTGDHPAAVASAAASDAPPPDAATRRASPPDAPPGPPPPAAAALATGAASLDRAPATADPAATGAASPDRAPADPAPHARTIDPARDRDGDPAPASAPHAGGVPVATRHAGLFYLAGRVLEIDLAEALWTAGVPEGDLLAHVARAILDDDDDPAWRWFGGGFAHTPPLPVVPAWAVAEVGAAVQHALGRRLVRFGVALTPAQLGVELDRLAVALTRTRDLADPATATLVARSAAALACIACARLGQPPAWSTVRAFTSRPGHLVLTDDAVRVLLPAAAVELDHRRAGLDHDPGHLPWLSRRLRFEITGLDVL